jgi:hypothetical protein
MSHENPGFFRRHKVGLAGTVLVGTLFATGTIPNPFSDGDGGSNPGTKTEQPANPQKAPEFLPSKEQLVSSEQTAWDNFFGYPVDIPTPPQTLLETLKQIQDKGYTTMEAHYIPPVSAGSASALGWRVKPESGAWDNDSKVKVGGYWVLVDGIENAGTTNHQAGDPYADVYNNDPLASIMSSLRETGTIGIDSGISDSDKGTRFDTTWNEVHSIILPQIAQEFGISSGAIRLTYFLEENVLGNVFHPDWGNHNAQVMTEDTLNGGQVRITGSNLYGGLAGYSDYSDRGSRDVTVGFRPVVAFSQ